jgi:hypothetical protein
MWTSGKQVIKAFLSKQVYHLRMSILVLSRVCVEEVSLRCHSILQFLLLQGDTYIYARLSAQLP